MRHGTPNRHPKYWHGPVPETDDFGVPIINIFYDAKAVSGHWAMMSPTSFAVHGLGTGPGLGQRYELISGFWRKTK